MGNVGSIYNAVAGRHTPETSVFVNKALGRLDAMVKELKEDCLLVVTGFGVLLARYFIARMDIPGISSPACECFGKIRILASVSISRRF